MKSIESLGDLFAAVDCHATFYDVGRHIQRLTPQQVIQFDRKQTPYPTPFRQHAWLACVLSKVQAQGKEYVVWFIRLPVDEQACLNLGARDHFIKTIVDKIMHKGEEAGLQEALEDNPYAFQPDQERLASFHAKLGRDLKTQPSSYFAPVCDYIAGLPSTTDGWDELGLQGLAELAARVDIGQYESLILQAVQAAPMPLLTSLCHALEHEHLPPTVVQALAERLQESDISVTPAFIRALSREQNAQAVETSLLTLLGDLSSCSDAQIHIIAALIAKAPQWLRSSPILLRVIMEKLAHRDDGLTAFRQVLSELTQNPEDRATIWALLRSPSISPKLAEAVSQIFTPTQNTVQ
ncbi:DUF3549 family protein [Maribrevibacterium harenarium]|uniref:DUF3549 family protein n=1 Tax=Maribrevibacterium harenarium TaxID=2589817 RepID=A0A501WPE9_9GAMM|nr:DUF3549 family protein [Maribrevibacterium harenarium]TPE51319.1 DUF3549 family protein [Maribrevibacterium harenarium]